MTRNETAPVTNRRWPHRGGSFDDLMRATPEEDPVGPPADDEIVARDLPALAILLGGATAQPAARTSSSMSSANPT